MLDRPSPSTPSQEFLEAVIFLAELSTGGDEEELQRRLIRVIEKLAQSKTTILVLINDDHSKLLEYKTLDDKGAWVFCVHTDDGKRLVGDCLRLGQVIHMQGSDISSEFVLDCTGKVLARPGSLICAPLQASGETIGALLLIDKVEGVYNELDLPLVSAIASVGANSILTARRIQESRLKEVETEANRRKLAQTQRLLCSILDELPSHLYVVDQEYHLHAVSRRLAEPLGRNPDELTGQICYFALYNREKPCPECRILEVFSKGQSARRSERRHEAGGNHTDWDIDAYPILDENGRTVRVILHEQDVSEKRRLEAILAQSQKLAAVGQLAAGIAHEINNPLTAIIANAQILQRELPSSSDLLESVDLISRAGARAVQVVRNLLDFARKEKTQLGLVDINETIRRAVELVQHELVARGILIEVDLDTDLPPILASADNLQSVWLNLLLNAIDAIDRPPGLIRIFSCKSENQFQITITDSGKGISDEQISRIFEPFFTTKSSGHGTGLGLSVSDRIITQHGGYFQVESQVGQGSTFNVFLPFS